VRQQITFRPGEIELQPEHRSAFQTKHLRWMVSANLRLRGVLLECEAQAFLQALEPEGPRISMTKTTVLLNTSETHSGQRIKAVESQTFDARNGDETNLEPNIVGTGPVDCYRIAGVSRTEHGLLVDSPVVTFVFRTVSLTLERD
jgi:hypothetical protein